MQYILIVNHSPWGSILAGTALRIALAIIEGGHQVQAVFFREDGVYNSLTGTLSDEAATPLAESWAAASRAHGTELLVCDSSWQRRLADPPAHPFRSAGLVTLMENVSRCDRVLTF